MTQFTLVILCNFLLKFAVTTVPIYATQTTKIDTGAQGYECITEQIRKDTLEIMGCSAHY